MASQVEIANLALTLLGEQRIASLDDNSKPARETKAVFDLTRDALLGAYDWSFAKTRTQLPALATAPAFGFSNAFQLPSDCIRALFVGEYYVGADLANYRGAPTAEFTIEGRQILTNWSVPLKLIYIKRVTDPGQFSAPFVEAFGCRLAERLAESLTQSRSKREQAKEAFKESIRNAVRANAIELPPERLADDDWILSRL